MFRKPRLRSALLSTCAALVLLVPSTGAAAGSARPATTSAPAGAASVAATPSCKRITDFDRANFSTPTTIDNQYYPLRPGQQFSYTGHVKIIADDEVLEHRVVTTVTDLTKVINGVRTVVLWDQDYSEGQLVESELAFFAQDNAGNVWKLGEYPEEYEDGEFVGAPSTWIAGQAGARAGTLMPAEPLEETSSYLQGRAPEVDFYDCGQTVATGQTICHDGTCYEDVLVTEEWDPLAPEGGRQRKYYAPEVGNIRVEPTGGDEQETLVLEKVVQLSPAALAQAHAEACKLDRRGYQVSKDVYAHTRPAEPCSGA
jgi:hypothetical protein